MTKLGVGIIGCGNISTAYLRLAPLFKDYEIRGVADINTEAALAQSDAFGVPAFDVDGLLSASDIDIAVNLTIPAVHYQVTRQILRAGKHAYSEKPLVLSLDEGEDLRDLAASGGLRVGSAPDTFLGGAHQQARAMIDAGDLGVITAGTAHVMSHGMEHWHPNPDFFFQPGAGPMLDIGPYYVTNLVQLLGPVRRVAALATMGSSTRTITSEPRSGEVIPVTTPTNIHALLEFQSGATITLSTSWDVWAHRHANMELYGADGSLFVPDPNFFGGTLERSGTSDAISPVAPWDHPFNVLNDGSHANYRGAGLADMARAVKEGGPHRCSLELAIHVVEVMTATLKSGETGEFVTMTTTCDRPAALGPDDALALMA